MTPGILAGLLFIHGLITTAIGAGAIGNANAPALPGINLAIVATQAGTRGPLTIAGG